MKIQKIMFLVSLVSMVMVCFLLTGCSDSTYAQSEETERFELVARIVEVEYGDTMWEIADHFYTKNLDTDTQRDLIKQIEKSSHVTGDFLKAGDLILVEYHQCLYGSESYRKKLYSEYWEDYLPYKVKKGDTLDSIAAEWCKKTNDDAATYLDKLRFMNNLDDQEELKKGQKILIYTQTKLNTEEERGF